MGRLAFVCGMMYDGYGVMCMKLEEITACGECCGGCAKHQQGLCPGCIEADGYVPEWAGSGRCRVHACAREHQAQFCGVCRDFPCEKMDGMIHWKQNVAEHMRSVVRQVVPTLYLSDLDGTLLRSDQRTSHFTNETINRLVEKGMMFSYATARSYHTASKVTAGMNATMPLIVYNGAFIVDNATGKVLHAVFFAENEAKEIMAALDGAGIAPIVYSVADGRERMAYVPEKMHPAGKAFMETRKGDVRDTPLTDDAELLRGDTFYFTCIDTQEKLQPLYERFRDKYRCVYSRDIYSESQWLEIMPREAAKASAARRLMKLRGCKRMVAFGDHVNDLDMFALADECYAVANAVPELKAAATGIIGSNDEDGVARWFMEHVK